MHLSLSSQYFFFSSQHLEWNPRSRILKVSVVSKVLEVGALDQVAGPLDFLYATCGRAQRTFGDIGIGMFLGVYQVTPERSGKCLYNNFSYK